MYGNRKRKYRTSIAMAVEERRGRSASLGLKRYLTAEIFSV